MTIGYNFNTLYSGVSFQHTIDERANETLH